MNTKNEFELCAARLRTLADPDRLRIVDCLFRGPINVSELAEFLSEDIVKVSHHLGVLRNAEVVQAEKKGRFMIYSLHPEVLASRKTNDGDGKRCIDLGCCKVDLVCLQR
ncbi:metalloregulator ArsR/SmtB family transcription factor [bacterium]|nr:metalloregulator ArsR/SmtB family transcription factor [bacterium]